MTLHPRWTPRIEALLARERSRGQRVIEISRLTLHPDFRRNRRRPWFLVSFLFASAAAVCSVPLPGATALAWYSKTHSSCYRAWGLRSVPATRPETVLRNGSLAVVSYHTNTTLPLNKVTDVQFHASQLLDIGKCCTCADERRCPRRSAWTHEPGGAVPEAPDFLCPRLAASFLAAHPGTPGTATEARLDTPFVPRQARSEETAAHGSAP